jgi:DMSO/TMAO reductase YedYZ heme-binding membrane subunit
MAQLTGRAKTTKEKWLWAGKNLVFLAALIPLVKLAWLGLHNGLGANPIEKITRFWWLVKKDIAEPVQFAFVLTVLLGFRVAQRARKKT